MPKTEYDMVIKALQVMNYIAPEEQPAARDYFTALDAYRTFHQWVIKEFTRKARWNSDQVDDRVWTYLATWFAGDLAVDFPTSTEDIQRLQAGAANAERRVREILARERQNVTEAEYY